MKNLMILLFLFLLASCSDDSCWPTNTVNDDRPDILVIGDSISLGYTPHLQALMPAHDIVHNVCNAKSSRNGVEQIDFWLRQRKQWDAITFNHGLWDSDSRFGTKPEIYRKNLTEIARKIKKRSNNVAFILTTEVLPNTPNNSNAKVLQLNQIAIEVMTNENIPVIDLHFASEQIQHEHIHSRDIHFTEAGSEFLADYIYNDLTILFGL